jgi:hypothetical protein
MSLRTRLLPVADRLRARTGPSALDVRLTGLTITIRSWTGGAIGVLPADPSVTPFVDTSLALPTIYRIRQVTTREVASSGGRYEMGDVRVGPVTPEFTHDDGSTGGFAEAQLKPGPTDDRTEIIYVLSGAHAGEYALVTLESLRPLSWFLVLRRRVTTP